VQLGASSSPSENTVNYHPNPTTTSQAACPDSIAIQLDAMSQWRVDNKPGQMAIWHLLTDCFPRVLNGVTTIGLGWQASTCMQRYDDSLSSER